MNETDYRILLGVLRRESVRQIYSSLIVSRTWIYQRMEWLRDQGYIQPWDRNQYGKLLTKRGREAVRAHYGREPFVEVGEVPNGEPER